MLSDSRTWARFFEREFAATTLASANELRATRSWESSWASKLAAVGDVLAASRARHLYVTAGSHFAAVGLARSVCVQRVASIAEACPNFEQLFVRAKEGLMVEVLARARDLSLPSPWSSKWRGEDNRFFVHGLRPGCLRGIRATRALRSSVGRVIWRPSGKDEHQAV